MKIINNNYVISGILLALLVLSAVFYEYENYGYNRSYFLAGKAILGDEPFPYTFDYVGFLNLPIMAYLFVPFALFELGLSGTLFIYFEIVTYVAAMFLFLKYFATSNRDKWVIFILFLLCKNFYTCVREGQLTIHCFLFLTVMTIFYLRKKALWTGVSLNLAFLTKVPPGLFFLYFLFKKEYKIFGISVVSYLLVVLASLTILGLNVHLDYVENAFFLNAGNTLVTFNNLSVVGSITRIVSPLSLIDWTAVKIHPIVNVVTLAMIGLILSYMGKTIRRDRQDNPNLIMLEFSLITCVYLLIFPIVWIHYYLFLIFPLFVAYKNLPILNQRRYDLMLLAAFILTNLPTSIMSNVLQRTFLQDYHLFLKILVSLPVVGLVALFYLVVRQYRVQLVMNELDQKTIQESKVVFQGRP